MQRESDILVLDATVLIDYFSEKTDAETETLRKNFNSVVFNENETTVLVNTVVMLEFAGYLYYNHHQSVKEVKDALRRAKNHAHMTMFDYGATEFFDTVNRFNDLPQNLKCHVGELSLLPLINLNEIFVSSDNNPLVAYKSLNRKDLKKSVDTIPRGTDYQP